MALESSSGGIWVLNATWPEASDDLNQADDHMRNIKASIKNTFPNLSATASLSAGALNLINSLKTAPQTQLDALSKSLAAAISTQSTISESLSAEIARTDSLSAYASTINSRADTLSQSLTVEISRINNLSASLAAEIARADVLSANIAIVESQAFLYINDNGTADTATTSLTTITRWSEVGTERGLIASTVSGQIAISVTGVYAAFCAGSFSGAANITFDFKLFKNNTDTGFGARRKIGSGGDVGSFAFMGEVSANPNDVLALRVKSDAASSGYTLQFAQLRVQGVR